LYFNKEPKRTVPIGSIGGIKLSFVVAVDGPSGSGKGTLTKRIEKELGLMNLDTGATYRTVTLAVLREGLKLEEEDKIVKLLDNINIEIENGENQDIILLNGEDVSQEIRGKEVTANVSPVSSIIPLREKMVKIQRKIAEGKNVIVEGRDIGTVVFPNADLKIYLDADIEERARRRYEQEKASGIDSNYEEVLQSIKIRDEKDKNKKVGALKKAEDAIVIDTTNKSINEVVEEVKELIKKTGKI